MKVTDCAPTPAIATLAPLATVTAGPVSALTGVDVTSALFDGVLTFGLEAPSGDAAEEFTSRGPPKNFNGLFATASSFEANASDSATPSLRV